MDREQAEVIQRLTARYVSEYADGNQPRLSEYLSSYPQYTNMIADFVTYYHAIEVNVPQESDSIPPLTQASRAALDEAWKNIVYTDFEVNHTLNSLQVAAKKVNKSFIQVALEIGLGQDILKQLDQHAIDAATIPQELYHRLAKALHQPLAAIEMYLGMGKQKQVTMGIAESSSIYHVEGRPVLDVHVHGFQEAVEQSKHMSDEQKGVWYTILVYEGLS
ncbi:MAG TPA: hypothetical protein VN954_10820 [Ktedonobacteraceae bacterium]|nr:hypothetical protein [Ktedonobacteraceae bacterium]